MGLIKFLVGVLLAIAGFGFMIMFVMGLPLVAIAGGSFWVTFALAAAGLIVGLIGIYLVRSR